MTYVLDSNIIFRYIRGEANVHQYLNKAVTHGDYIVIPRMVHYEVRRGFRILHKPKKESAYEKLIQSKSFCKLVEMNSACWERAELVYEELYRKGFTVGEMDILIAAMCLENGFTLVTNNVKHFKDIDGLLIENWTM